jgi:glucose-6-phosphate isomerase
MSSPNKTQYDTCLEYLLELKAPSRLGTHDTTLFTVHPDDSKLAENLLGWTDLSSKPPLPICEIVEHARAIKEEGLDAVVLIGQGGSSQAAMSITKLNEIYFSTSPELPVAFRTMDSLSPVYVNHILESSDPSRTLYIVSSKSGSTIEVLMLERVAWRYVADRLGTEKASQRFVAITDPDSGLDELAQEKKYRFVLSTPCDVGGRFSALTAFGLFPAALVGIDIEQALEAALATEQACISETPDNPALILASFLYAGYLEGRDKFSLILPPSAQVFGLWVEQLVAESLGKEGKGILPNVEVDASVLNSPRADRTVIAYAIGSCEGFKESLERIDKSIPILQFAINTPGELFSRFVVWEYAITFLSIVLKVFPFDQPNVEATKTLVKDLLAAPRPAILRTAVSRSINSVATLRASDSIFLEADATVDQALQSLLDSLNPGDYFSLNAFLPFRSLERREALERMRNHVASRLGIASCLEIGPRYLHSTGQFHKGGSNNGVFLIISADEDNDISIPDEDFTLGTLAATQAEGDFAVLASRDRRVIHIHLTNNDAETLTQFADRFCSAVSAVNSCHPE